MCREYCMPSLMCLTEGTLTTPVFKYFWHSQTGYLGLEDGVKSYHSHMCPTTFLHTLYTCNRQSKLNSFMKSKWWRVLFRIFEMEQQKTLVVQELEFWPEKQFWNKTTFQKFQSCYVPSSAIPKIKCHQQTKLDVPLQQCAAFSETA